VPCRACGGGGDCGSRQPSRWTRGAAAGVLARDPDEPDPLLLLLLLLLLGGGGRSNSVPAAAVRRNKANFNAIKWGINFTKIFLK